MHKEAKLTGTPSVEPDTGKFLETFAYVAKPQRVLELGCGIGVSTRYISNGAPDAHITAVDYNKDRLKHAAEACEGRRVDFVNSEVISFLEDNKSTYDMIFVDSMKKQYPIVFYYVYQMLNSGGTVIFDDMFIYGEVFCRDCEISPKYINVVKTMRDFMQKVKNEYKHSFLPVGGGLMLVRK